MKNNTKTILYHTKVTKNDTCYSYALKRVFGFGISYDRPLSEYSSHFNAIPYESSQIKIGDILLWDANAYTKEIPVSIDGSGNLTNRTIEMNRHCVVVENVNPIIVSECKLCTEEFNTPHLRIKNIEDFKRLPDKILRLKNN